MDIDSIHDMLIDHMNEDSAKKILDAIAPKKIWIVTAVDIGDSCDGKARVIGAYNDEQKARDFITADMEGYVNDAEGMNLEVDYGKMTAHTHSYEYGCDWNIEEVEVK